MKDLQIVTLMVAAIGVSGFVVFTPMSWNSYGKKGPRNDRRALRNSTALGSVREQLQNLQHANQLGKIGGVSPDRTCNRPSVLPPDHSPELLVRPTQLAPPVNILPQIAQELFPHRIL
jgi:hypothetical protein